MLTPSLPYPGMTAFCQYFFTDDLIHLELLISDKESLSLITTSIYVEMVLVTDI